MLLPQHMHWFLDGRGSIDRMRPGIATSGYHQKDDRLVIKLSFPFQARSCLRFGQENIAQRSRCFAYNQTGGYDHSVLDTFVQLTEERSAWDQPKQLQKKVRELKMLHYECLPRVLLNHVRDSQMHLEQRETRTGILNVQLGSKRGSRESLHNVWNLLETSTLTTTWHSSDQEWDHTHFSGGPSFAS